MHDSNRITQHQVMSGGWFGDSNEFTTASQNLDWRNTGDKVNRGGSTCVTVRATRYGKLKRRSRTRVGLSLSSDIMHYGILKER